MQTHTPPWYHAGYASIQATGVFRRLNSALNKPLPFAANPSGAEYAWNVPRDTMGAYVFAHNVIVDDGNEVVTFLSMAMCHIGISII